MPIRIPDSLPARKTLDGENIFVITEHRALHQDIRPLKLLILNLMPTKIVTETQLLRQLSNTPLQVEIDLLRTISHNAKNVDSSHLDMFYVSYDDICDRFYDGMIITGAPVENLDFDKVDYWPELCEIMEWSKTHVHSTFHICWGAQAGLYYHYGIPKHSLDKKKFGIYSHRILTPNSPFFRGFDDTFNAPHSRYTEIRAEDIEKKPDLEIMAVSDEAGVFAVKNQKSRQFFIFGHPEYDRETLALEYQRDVKNGKKIDVPVNYYPDDDPTREPMMTWRAHAQLMYTNWLNYYVYQTTPYIINKIDPNADGEERDEQ
ncbi:MAG: homoserine O-succinyltransferase [Clostridiales bacterium]|nr:homoserine O-succinyltransferase [Clostridiales bacterium]